VVGWQVRILYTSGRFSLPETKAFQAGVHRTHKGSQAELIRETKRKS